MKDKTKKFIKELLRYSVAGMTAFVFDTAVKTLFYSMILPVNMGSVDFWIFNYHIGVEVRVAVATFFGFLVGLLINYLISIFFVFTTDKQKEMGRGIKAFLIYLAVSVVGLLINIAITQIGCNIFAIERNPVIFTLVSCAAAFVALLWNYFGRKRFVYKGE